jgi:hypothetical protein
MKTLPVRHAGSPLVTNAQLNREAAQKCYAAGMTPEQIAAEFPEVWQCKDGKLSQKYDYELADGSGRYETNRRITSEAVRKAIARHAKGKK